MHYDVAIVGGGAVGSEIAYRLSKKGYKVIVFEKKKIAGKRACGGLISTRVMNLRKSDAILNEIKGARIFFPDGRELCIGGDKVRAYVIDREKFDREIAEDAMAEGARYITGYVVRGIKYGEQIEIGDISCDFLIGADGAMSTVAKIFSLGKINYIYAMQGEGKGFDDDYVEVYLSKKLFPGFFGWVIPAGDKTRVGVGVENRMVRKYFNHFAKKIETRNVTYGIIPVGLRKFHKKNIALAGDSAGQVKATSGGGIYTGLMAGKMLADYFPDFERYEKEYMRRVGRELKRCLVARKWFNKIGDEMLNSLYDVLKEEIVLINEYGDIDYPSVIIKELLKRFVLGRWIWREVRRRL